MLTCKSLSWTCEVASFSSYILVLVLAPVQELTLPLVIISCFPFFPITSHWGQDSPPLFLSSWLLKNADPLPRVLVWVSFLRIDWGRTFLQTEHMVPGVTEMLCPSVSFSSGKRMRLSVPQPFITPWLLVSDVFLHWEGALSHSPSALPRGESMRLQKYPGSCQTFAYGFRIHQGLLLATVVVTATAWERFLLFPSILYLWMGLLIGRTLALSASSYLVSLTTSWLFALFWGDNSARLVLFRFS